MTNTTKQPLLTKVQKVGLWFYGSGSALAIEVAYQTGGLLAARGALSTALLGIAAMFGVAALKASGGSGKP